jgi:hypothetical protein
MLKKLDCALFTIVRNEKFFLPIWYNYYSKQINPKNIFILDHESSDDSTSAYQNVTLIQNNFTQNHKWMANVSNEFQKKLLKKYKWVIFSHVDEIICPDPEKYESIIDFLKINKNLKKIRCKGYEVIQFPEEPKVSSSKNILNIRKLWFSNDVYSKPLVTQVPINWTPGWHGIQKETLPINKDLILIHLHRADYENCYNKRFLSKKQKIYQEDLNKKWGWYINIEEKEFRKWFYSIESSKILNAEHSFLNFENNKNQSEKQIIEKARNICEEIKEKWKCKI